MSKSKFLVLLTAIGILAVIYLFLTVNNRPLSSIVDVNQQAGQVFEGFEQAESVFDAESKIEREFDQITVAHAGEDKWITTPAGTVAARSPVSQIGRHAANSQALKVAKRLDYIAETFNLKLLSESDIAKLSYDSALSATRRFVQSQLLRERDYPKLIALAQKVGVNSNLVESLQARLGEAECDKKPMQVNQRRASDYSTLQKRKISSSLTSSKPNPTSLGITLVSEIGNAQGRLRSGTSVCTEQHSLRNTRQVIISNIANRLAQLRLRASNATNDTQN